MQDSGDVVFEPGVRDSRVVPVAVVRRTLWLREILRNVALDIFKFVAEDKKWLSSAQILTTEACF